MGATQRTGWCEGRTGYEIPVKAREADLYGTSAEPI